jgi:hypothetical protein
MIGSRICADFVRYDFDTACEKLLTEISLQRKQSISNIRINRLIHEKPGKTRLIVSERVQKNKKNDR